MDAVKAELKKLAKDINPEVLKRYETKRSERIFPIICAVKNDRLLEMRHGAFNRRQENSPRARRWNVKTATDFSIRSEIVQFAQN